MGGAAPFSLIFAPAAAGRFSSSGSPAAGAGSAAVAGPGRMSMGLVPSGTRVNAGERGRFGMDDEALAKELNMPVGYVMVMSPKRRADLERLVEAAAALNRGDRPPGVLVD